MKIGEDRADIINLVFIIFQEEALQYGIDWDGPPLHNSTEHERNGIVVQRIPCPLNRAQLQVLKETVDPCAESSAFGSDLYLKTADFIKAELGQI